MKNKVIVIAEAGVNHNGSLENAFKLIDVAVAAKVDYVKFQTFKADNLVTRIAEKADYQNNNTPGNESQYSMLKKLELSDEQHQKLISYCQDKNIKFFSTAFDLESLNYLRSLGLNMVKIPSGEITNLPYLRTAARLFEKVIISTGMATLQEVNDALKVFLDAGISKKNITIMHCTTEYPTPMQEVNLKAMQTLADTFGTAVGYSDHTEGIEVPIAAVTLGASMIEKHFTLDRNMEGPDHRASLDPAELQAMVSSIRNVEQALAGSGHKEPTASEMKNIAVARKSIIAKQDIKAGDVFNEHNITTKRPGTGLSPMLWDDVIGKIALRDFKADDLIKIEP